MNSIEVRELRRFGFVWAGFLLTFFVVAPLLRNRSQSVWPWILVVGLTSVSMISPAILRRPRTIWISVSALLGAVHSRITLTLVYFLLIVPLAAILRTFRFDKMNRKFEPEEASYRINRVSVGDRRQLERIF